MTIHLALLIAYCVVHHGDGPVRRPPDQDQGRLLRGRPLARAGSPLRHPRGRQHRRRIHRRRVRPRLPRRPQRLVVGRIGRRWARWCMAFLVGPKIRRIAADRGLHTVGDFLEYRYGRNVRGIVSSLLWVGTLAILAGQIIAMGLVLNAVLGLPRYVGCLLGGIVMTVYFTAGGLLTSAWVNALQLVLELVGLRAARSGGPRHAPADGRAWPRPHLRAPTYWSFWQGGASGVGLPRPARPGLHHLAGSPAEGLRRARRPHRPHRRRRQRRRCCCSSPSYPSSWAWSRACCTPIWSTTSWPCPPCSCATCLRSSARSDWPRCSRRR